MIGRRREQRRSQGRWRARIVGTATILALLVLPLLPATPAHAQSGRFVVNSTADTQDAGGLNRNGICATNTGVCTLRAALQEASAYAGPATITFALPGVTGPTSPPATITVGTRLPVVTNPAGVTVDGYSQVGSSPNTAVDGSNAALKVQVAGPGGTTLIGFTFQGANNVVRGLAVYGFQYPVLIIGEAADNNKVVGNFLCTNAAGTYQQPESTVSAAAVNIQDGADQNLVGSPDPADRNIMSGCPQRGVNIGINGTQFNKVQNNVVGLTPDGSAALPNKSHGIDVNYAQDNLIGGTGVNERNIVSGNGNTGIEVSHGTGNRRNNILSNCVGTDLTCTRLLGYTGNGQFGIRLEGEGDCEPSSCILGSGFHEVAFNVVVGNGYKTGGPGWGGLAIDKGQNHNNVHDNWIGLLPDGTPAGNLGSGVRIERMAQYNRIGPNNIIANNTKGGIEVQPIGTNPPSGPARTIANVLTRNTIYANGANAGKLGIDLAPIGVPNVDGVSDPDTANQVQPPSITTLTTTSMTGKACAGCAVEAYLADSTSTTAFGQGRTFLAGATAGADGAYTVTFPSALADGKTVTANQTTPGIVDPKFRNEGPFGDTSEFAKNVKVGGPAVADLTVPAFVGPANVTAVPVGGTAGEGGASASGTLTDANGLVVNAGPAAVDPSTRTFTLNFDASSVAEGSLSVSVIVTDGAGQQGSPATATTTKDVTAPALTSSSPADGEPVTTSPGTIAATFGERLAEGAAMTVTDGSGNRPGTVALSPDGTNVTFTPDQPLPSGSYTTTVTGTDAAGNAVNATFAFTVNVASPPLTFTLASTVNSITATITPPTGGEPVDGYRLVYTPQGGSAVTVDSTDPKIVVGKLPEGTTYSVTVAPHTAAGYGAPSPPQEVTTKFRTTVTATTTPTGSVPAGGTLTINGSIFRTSAPETTIGGARPRIFQVNASDPTQATQIGSPLTAADGTYTFSYKPPSGTWVYRVDYVGSSTNSTATVTTPAVTVG